MGRLGSWAVERAVDKWEKGGDLLWDEVVEKYAIDLILFLY